MIIYSNKYFGVPKEVITAFDNEELRRAFSRIEQLKNDNYLVGYLRYEAKDVFLNREIKSEFPLLYFEVHEFCEKFDIPASQSEVYLKVHPQISYEDYAKAIKSVKDEISCGNTYEVNYTCGFDVETEFSSDEIFNSLIRLQNTPYCALIKNEFEDIISFSPELFFRRIGNNILTKPMKGTIKRGLNAQEDEELKNFLRTDVKNRAENVMIVDLLRNDLGRIANVGTVKVPKLFDVETFKTLHQMSSEITAELPESITYWDIFNAIFPCGSITGAPKISTMDIIDRLEVGKRNVYCGAIGYIYKDFCEFSVPIRILQKTHSDNVYNYRAGGAIVWDSSCQAEWDEVILKGSFLTANRKNWKLIETVLVKDLKPQFWDEHISRMKNSALDLGYIFNEEILDLKFDKDGIYRIELSKSGDYKLSYRECCESKTNKIKISQNKVSSKDLFLYHKTDFRPYYQKSFEAIKNNEIYDEIFFNERNELTEGARSNIIIKKDDKYYTPPVSCGLLNGVYRKHFIATTGCIEKVLYLEDLKSADKIYCVNSVRGMKEVSL